MMLFDYMMTYGRIIATSLGDSAKAVLVNLTGIGHGDDPADGEGSTGEALFGQLGVVARPKSPSKDGHAEVIAARTEDGLQPLVHRDLRLNQRVNPKEGEVDIVQYGGGFVSLRDNADGQGTTVVAFAPKLKADGSVDRAHSVILDTGAANNAVTIVHMDGMAITMFDGKLVLQNKERNAFIELKDQTITLSAANIICNGAVTLGDPATAVPMAQGASFLGSQVVRVSP